MKTSINVDDWLHAQATDLNPGVPFGQLVRDALLIALPTWSKAGTEPAATRALRIQLRYREAQQQHTVDTVLAGERAKRATRDRARRAAKRAATPPA